jgi:nucleotide-binding universal stress UspA family protein
MIRDVVLALRVDADRDVARDYALSVAAAFNAHIAAIGFAYDPIVPPVEMGYIGAFDLIDAQREEYNKAAMAAISRFEEAARLAAVSFETRLVKATIPGAGIVFGSIARSFDLSVVCQARPDASREDLLIEGALFESGRPVLVVPYIWQRGLRLERVTACWDGSSNAARAINDAMPFLARAKSVDVVTVRENDKATEIPGLDIVHHLAHHGLKVDLRTIIRSDIDVANAILSDAADRDTDLLVMGGYGHSRLREFVLGGATRGILASMTVPTLMSH